MIRRSRVFWWRISWRRPPRSFVPVSAQGQGSLRYLPAVETPVSARAGEASRARPAGPKGPAAMNDLWPSTGTRSAIGRLLISG